MGYMTLYLTFSITLGLYPQKPRIYEIVQRRNYDFYRAQVQVYLVTKDMSVTMLNNIIH